MTATPYPPAAPLDPTSDEFVTPWDEATAAYDNGERPDPDALAAGDRWALLLHEVDEYVGELRLAVVLDAVERLRRPDGARSMVAAKHVSNAA